MDQPTAEPELTPEELERLSRRDPDVLGRFFDLWFPRVFAFVRRMTADEHLSEDLTQDVFFQIYRGLAGYDPKRALKPWVFAIATNKVRDYWRSRRHGASLKETGQEREDAPGLSALPARSESPDAPLRRGERVAAVRRAIDALPETMRLALVLRVYDELSFEEIGAILGRNEVAARKRYSRALEALRGSLAGYAGEADVP